VTRTPSPTSGAATPIAPNDAHEWVSFDDPDEERTYVFDVTFLASSWTCIFGAGCQGVLTGPAPELAQGCCSYGAHFTGEDDVRRVRAAAKELTDEQWQFKAKGRRGGIVHTEADGTRITRLVDDACIFLNRPGFPGGPGCALHRAALDADRLPLELKPDVCWQLPLRRDEAVATDGHVTTTITQWDRHHWGDGGQEFHWWCTEAPEAFVGKRPVYLELGGELIAMVGPVVYEMVADYLRTRLPGAVPLPHPMVRAK
jgi:hypothetical protein